MAFSGEASAYLLDTSDIVILVVIVVVVGVLIWRRLSTSNSQPKSTVTLPSRSVANSSASHSLSSARLGSFIQQMNDKGKNAIFFFGSQTGTAEDYANRLAREAKQFGFQTLVADMEQYDLADLKQITPDKLVFFVVATYGEGEPTDNSQDAYKLYHEEEHEPNSLSGLKYVVFGLGNKTYEQFNAMGKFWDSKLSDLGGKRLFDAGVGDDDGNLEEDFLTWKDKMWPVVCKEFGIDMEAASQTTIRQFALKELAADEIVPEKVYKGEIGSLLKPGAKQTRPPYDLKNPYYADLKLNKEIIKSGDRHCMHIEISIKDTPLTYASGDHLGIFPVNDPEEVTRLSQRLGISNLDAVFTMTALDSSSAKKHPFPCPTTYRTALSHYLDITTIPRTHIVKALIEYAEDPSEKQRLEFLISAEGKDELNKYLNHDCRHLLAILEDFPSVHPPIDLVFELLPRLQCRYYSISSSPKVNPEIVSITAVVVEYTTPSGRIGKGVATTWLSTMKNCDIASYRVPVFIRKSNFKLPRNAAKGVIMVGPGTGLAPFRGFIQERAWLASQGKTVGPNILFFGCRHPDQDFLYEEELKLFESEGKLELHTAFSRYQAEKVYVQTRIWEQRHKIWSLLDDGACFYVCGDAKNMAREVQNVLIKIAQEVGGKSADDAHTYVKSLRTNNRYMEDVWS